MTVAAIIGGGVIGGGWAARFALMGWQVRLFDPDHEAGRKMGEVMANARRALPGLYDAALPAEAAITHVQTIAEAVSGADWIQESVPERLELKRQVFQTIQEHCPPGAVIGSSTSGFKPSELQGGATRPGQIVVTHPFNPVYLLPLIELVASPANPPELVARAKAVLEEIGCYPLLVRKEIDAHIADRFLEAVWREALWLIKDGVATTTEIDEAIRMGFGLRWAQMGLFETYRVAGGEAGMRHFIAQFGPCLSWPWTKLMDVPELTDALVEAIASQSDAQSGMHSIRELERIRDDNLVTILRGLKGQDWGAGAVLKRQEARIQALPGSMAALGDLARWLPTGARAVPADWIDYNGHMNEARYLTAFSEATDRFMQCVDAGPDYVAAGQSYFTAETHIRHLGEARQGENIEIETLCLEGAGKKLRLFHRMLCGGEMIATGEHMLIHVDLGSRASSLPGAQVADNIAAIAAAHAGLGQPEGAGRAIGAR